MLFRGGISFPWIALKSYEAASAASILPLFEFVELRARQHETAGA